VAVDFPDIMQLQLLAVLIFVELECLPYFVE